MLQSLPLKLLWILKKKIDSHHIVQFTHILTSSLFTLTSYLISAGVAELADAPDLGSGGTPVQVQVLSPAPITKESLTWLFRYFMRKVIGLEPALGEAEHNRVFAKRMMGRAHQVLSPAPRKKHRLCRCFFQLNPPLRVGEIACCDEIQLRWVKFASRRVICTFGA